MNRKIELLYRNRWVSLFNYNGYVYSEETRCGGHVLSVLPYMKKPSGMDGRFEIKFLLRRETTPAWKTNNEFPVADDHLFISSITGGVEHPEDIVQDALRELEEEAGYVVDREKMISLGTTFGAKSSNTVYHYFACDLTGLERKEAVGDGSELEKKEHCEWHDNINASDDPLVYVAWNKLIRAI